MHLVIGLAGDCMLGRLVNEHLKNRPPESLWGDFLEEFQKTDLNIINLENTFTTSSKKVLKSFNFKSDPKNVAVLQRARIDVVNLANNHILDYGEVGLQETLETLDLAGIQHVGAGRNLEEAKKLVIIERSGVKVGILGYTDNEPLWNAGGNKPGVRYIRVGDKTIEKDILAIRPKVDVLLITFHWGPNMRQEPSPEFREFAHFIVDCGVDIIHGHSAHIFQGVEYYKRGLILYDTGNVIDDFYVDPHLRNDQSFLFLVTAGKKGFEKLEMIPSTIKNCTVSKAQGEEKEAIFRRMDTLSQHLMAKP